MITESSTGRIVSRRWDIIDVARGVAICAMILYHFSWDLSFLKLVATNVLQEPGWRWFARCIAGSFLVLTGISLALAHAQGVRKVAFLKRLARIGGAAALVTVATYFAFPDSYIFFGILHCIAASSILALPFLRLPPLLSVVGAVICFAAPMVLTDRLWDRPWLDWLGLGTAAPVTNDYVPIFPWFGFVLLGLGLGRGLLLQRAAPDLARWRTGRLGALVWMGRKSLPIYLIHQPVLLAVLFGLLQVTGPNPSAEARPFLAQCEAQCVQGNDNPPLCRAACSCIVDRLRRDGIWQSILADEVTQESQVRASQIAQQCVRETPP